MEVGLLVSSTERGGKQFSVSEIGLLFSSIERGGIHCPESSTMDVGTPSLDAERDIQNEPTIWLDDDDLGGRELGQATLVGNVITYKPLNRGAVKCILDKAWGSPEGLQVADVGFNLFLFTFNSQEEAEEILRRSPWYVMNKLINLRVWNPQMVMNEIDFSKVPFWVQVQGLPLEYITVRSAEKILQ